MEEREAVTRIHSLLKTHPKGLTISKMASLLKMNRNSTAKYLEVLHASGSIDSRTVGTAKVFYLSHRVPVSALLKFSSDFVCTLDSDTHVLYANQKFLDFFGLTESEVEGIALTDVCPTGAGVYRLSHLLPDLLREQEETTEISVYQENDPRYFKLRKISTTFEDGMVGTTILMEDVTNERIHLNHLEFLARTSATFADMEDEENIYQFIADQIAKLVPDSLISVTSIHQDTRSVVCEALSGDMHVVEGLKKGLGELVGKPLPLDAVPQAEKALSRGILDEGAPNLYLQTFKIFPKEVCDRLQNSLQLGKNYSIGCVCRGGLFGSLTIRLKEGRELRHTDTIEAFVRQASVALQRKHMREKVLTLERLLKHTR